MFFIDAPLYILMVFMFGICLTYVYLFVKIYNVVPVALTMFSEERRGNLNKRFLEAPIRFTVVWLGLATIDPDLPFSFSENL